MAWNDPNAKQEAQKYANPIPSRTLILQTLEKKGDLSHSELAAFFELANADQFDALGHRLKAMLRDVQIKQVASSPAVFAMLSPQDLLTGKVESHPKGFGFLIQKDAADLFLSEQEMRKVFHGDTVQVLASHTDKRGRQYGKIIKVTARQQQKYIGKLSKDDDGYYVALTAPNAHQPICLEAADVTSHAAKLGDAVAVLVEIYPTDSQLAAGDMVAVLSDDTDKDVMIQSTLLDHDIPHQFTDAIINRAASFREPASASLLANPETKRKDLRELALVTIDGEDARDFDDAVFAQKRAGGGFRLVVAIADVSHYVTPNDVLDKEAWQRGTSVYFPQLVVPMLPEALSNGLCSLNPQVDRLCMVCDLTLSRAGRVTGYEFYPAIMHSQARLTYTQVADYMQASTAEAATPSITKNAAVKKSIDTLAQLMQVMLTVRKDRHAMEFETTETYMLFHDDGSIDKILPRSRNDAHKLIEECMLLANICAADFAQKHKLPVLYRNHEAPDASRTEKLRGYLNSLGISFVRENPTQADYAAVIDATKDRPDAISIHSMLLRSMMQAYYGEENIGHFGLAYEKYGHFTSPIRRYPDLMLHRAIKAHVLGKSQPTDAGMLAQAGEHLSMTERRAEEASRHVVSWLKCHYMQQHLGEEYTGVISAVAEFGVFVTLTDLFVDGLVHISELGDDFFEYDNRNQVLLGKATGQVFGLGDTLVVQVAGVSLEEKKIDFKLVSKQKSANSYDIKQIKKSLSGLSDDPKKIVLAKKSAKNTKEAKNIENVTKMSHKKTKVKPRKKETAKKRKSSKSVKKSKTTKKRKNNTKK